MSKRELELMIKLQNQGKEAIEHINFVGNVPLKKTLFVRNRQNIDQLVGFDRNILRPEGVYEDVDGVQSLANKRQRATAYMNRLMSSSVPNLDTSRLPNESSLDYYNRFQTILRNLPEQATIDEEYIRKEKQELRNHLSELMNDEETNRVLNDPLYNNIQTIEILNNTWQSFVNQLKERFRKLDVNSFIEFTRTYVEDYRRTKGVIGLQPVIQQEQQQEEPLGMVYAEGNFTYIINFVSDKTISVIVKQNRIIEEEIRNLTTRTRAPNNKSFKDAFELATPLLYNFIIAEGPIRNKEQLIERIKLLITLAGNDTDEQNPYTDDDLVEVIQAIQQAQPVIPPQNQLPQGPAMVVNPGGVVPEPNRNFDDVYNLRDLFVGEGLRKKKNIRNIKKKILQGQIHAGNNNPLIYHDLRKLLRGVK